jgi:hypothetical protein
MEVVHKKLKKLYEQKTQLTYNPYKIPKNTKKNLEEK